MRINNFTILVVDDEIEYQNTMSIILGSKGYRVLTASSGNEAIETIKDNDVDLVITDLKMPGLSGIELVKRTRCLNSDINIIIVTAYGTIESAVEAIKLGADSYFVKSDDPQNLISAVGQLAKIKELSNENRILKETFARQDAFLESKSKAFKKVLDVCDKAAETNINVLLLGESGVGKEVVANYIHVNSSRCNNHFVPVNCQSFSSGLIESELFGHEKGAFTGASGKRIGRFEEAHSGTIFLDEIGDLPLDTQSKLLRTIENRTIERLGSNKRIELDFRIISATNKNIEELISTGDFREDLFYRINTLTLTIPPLRERREDIPGLIDFFVKKIEKEQKKPIKRIDDDVLDKLYNYDYPGNVRELKNLLERLITLSENGIITFDKSDGYLPINFNTHLIKSDGLREARKAFEKEYIEGALKLNKYNISKTANQIKISDRQLWNKISELEIEIVKK